MKTIPILFSTAMVQALVAGTKTQTRRLNGLDSINKEPEQWFFRGMGPNPENENDKNWYAYFCTSEDEGTWIYIKCTYGKRGDILWVRETYYAYGWWIKEGSKWRFVDFTPEDAEGKYHYEDNKPSEIVLKREANNMGWHKRPAIFMPKPACRLFLKIKSVRVERLQSISEADAVAEGLINNSSNKFETQILYKDYLNPEATPFVKDPAMSYKTLWQKINGSESWDANPYVWVVEFEKCDKPDNF